ncbi:MAG: sugar kinase [Haloechinothrix sp.]
MSEQRPAYRRLVGFGEAMLRLTTSTGETLETTSELHTSVGGAELNGLIAATRSGMPSTWVTSLPDNPLGRIVLRHTRANGVDLVAAAPKGPRRARLGLYFVEMAPPPRPTRITYDRSASAFARLDPHAINWHELLDAETCLYITGITPPLGDGPRQATDDAIRTARQVGATVALDVNYRSDIWSRKEAGSWLISVLPDIDILSAGAADLKAAGLSGDDPLGEAVNRFGIYAAVTTTKHRLDGSEEIDLSITTPTGEQRATAKTGVVDPIGAGDALFGTLLALLPTTDLATATNRALGAAVTCYGLFGDALVADPWDATQTRGVIR